MKWRGRAGLMLTIGGLVLMAAAWVWAAKGQDRAGREHCVSNSPLKIPGAKVAVINSDNGVIIYVDGETRDAVRRIQRSAEEMKDALDMPCSCSVKPRKTRRQGTGAVYYCTMGDYTGPQTKDGRCPKCGMQLHKK